MKVLILGNKIFSFDMQWGFLQNGWEAFVVSAFNADQMEKVMNDHSDADLIITLGAPLELKFGVMEWLAKKRPASLKHIHWDTDGISSTYYQSKSGDGIEMDVIYASKPDLVLTVCPEMQELIVQKGFACKKMHYAYSPVSHHPMESIENENRSISLIGNSYSVLYPYHPEHYRFQSLIILLKSLIENGYDIHLYGDRDYLPVLEQLLGVALPQVKYHGFLPYERTCAAYNGSFINLVTQNHTQTITKRTFEILGSGGFALSADNAELRKLFIPGRDLAVSSSPEETLEQVKYYEGHPEQWRKVRENAVKSVEKHTYKQRAEFIIEEYQKLIG